VTEQGRAGLVGGFESRSHLIRFCLAILFIAALAVLLVWFIGRVLTQGQELSVSFNKEGATIVFVGDRPSKALVLLSASQPWADTGLTVLPGQKISITASGLANLAIHRLVEAADKDERPRHGWAGPEGGEPKNEKAVDRFRRALRIEPRVAYGCLLAYVRPVGEPDPGKEFPRPPGIHVIGRNGELTYADSKSRMGTLFLTANDAVARDDPESERAYVTDQAALNATYGPGRVTVDNLRERWRRLRDANYWEVWFDDNVGEYLVQVDFTPRDDSR
jgi:hypothetical protein